MSLMERSYADFYEPSRWRRAKGRIKKLGTWLWSALGLGVILGGYVAAVLSEIAPAPKDFVCLAQEQFREPAPGTLFTILISNLAGDDDGRQTNLVRDVFLGQNGVDVRRTCRVVALDAAGGSLANAEAAATAVGRTMLDDWNADLLIWGEVKKKDEELNLWFLSRETGGSLGGEPYSVSETLSLPSDFREDLAAQLETVAFSQIEPTTSTEGNQLVSLLKPPAEKLRGLFSAGHELLPEPRTALIYSFAQAAATIGIQTHEPQWLEEALAAYRQVLSQWTRERVPLGWAAAQQGLGTAYFYLGSIV